MPFVNFRKKFRFFSFDFCQNFYVRTFPRWLSIRGTKFFWWAIQKFFFQNLHFGPISWVPRRFLKISIIYSQNLHFNWVFLSIFRKLRHVYAEHTRKCLKVVYLGRIEYDFQKSRVTGPWDLMVSFSAKKVYKKFHDCVPLNNKPPYIKMITKNLSQKQNANYRESRATPSLIGQVWI
jgi:hypothetical protein